MIIINKHEFILRGNYFGEVQDAQRKTFEPVISDEETVKDVTMLYDIADDVSRYMSRDTMLVKVEGENKAGYELNTEPTMISVTRATPEPHQHDKSV